MTEAEILKCVPSPIQIPRNSTIIAGIGDDCAIYRSPHSSEDLLLTTDLLIEGRHFLTTTHRPVDIGHKAVARGLSDIAAMGGEARFCLLSLALPKSVTPKWVDSFYSGLLKLAGAYGCVLAGGDLARSDR